MSNKEFEIIQLLSSNAGQVFDREKIYENIWGIDGNGDSVVIKEHIRKIRLKFNEFTDKGYITTVWGVGYKWENKRSISKDVAKTIISIAGGILS